MTPAQIIAVCSRIAAIIGPDARVYVFGSPHYGSEIGITVRPLGYASDREQRTFTAPHWQDMLIQAECYAHEFVARRGAGDVEYRSWIEPQLPLAAE